MLDKVEIGERIASERKKMKLNRDKFAELIGLSSYYIGQLERGNRSMSLETLDRICDCLHISSDYILHGQKEAPADTSDLQELLYKCTDKERDLILDVLKVAMPYLNGLK